MPEAVQSVFGQVNCECMAPRRSFDYHRDRSCQRNTSTGRQHGTYAHVVDNFQRSDRALVHEPPHASVGLEGAGDARDPEVGRVEAEVGPLRTAESERVAWGDVEAFLA
jgi:hypothetical protein